MFKKTRRRIFALIMAIATVIITLMLLVIYIANAKNSFERSMSLLESYIDNRTFGYHMSDGLPDEDGVPMNADHPAADGVPVDADHPATDGVSADADHPINEGVAPDWPENQPDFRHGIKDEHSKMFKLSTFYSVMYIGDGTDVKVDCGDGTLYSAQEIQEITDSILSKGKSQGKYGQMSYLVRTVPEGTMVALIDDTMEVDNSDRLFVNSLIVGISTWVIILILSWIFSKKIVHPLEENDLKQKQFISDAGHELKTPISVISANADILAMELGDNKWLANIQYENERMGTLVKQLLELVRAENRQMPKERLDFSRLVSGGTLPFESVAFEHGLIIDTQIEDGIMVEGNRSQLSQMVSIFVDNAIEHSEGGREIGVKLCSKKNHAILSVTNPGKPIPEEVRARLFERFYQVDEARTEDHGHYGLGLAIAKAIATAHGGKIELDCHDGCIEFRFVVTKTT